MNKICSTLFWLLVLGGVINYYLTANYVTKDDQIKLQAAHVEYVLGETTKSPGDRIEAFNNSLSKYLELDVIYEPNQSSGRFYYNIGNNYFQLGEYSWALLYYYRAVKLMPREEKVKLNLFSTLEKLGFKKEHEITVFENILFFHSWFSLPERLQMFFFLSSFSILFVSFYIWTKLKVWKRISFTSLFLACIMLLSVTYSFYLAPIEAVFVKSSAIYRGAGEHYAKVARDPIKAGIKVEVLQVFDDGLWLKVITQDGDGGYVSQKNAKII